MSAAAHEPFSEEARQAFAALLERRDREAGFDFGSALAERPQLEDELRALHARWLRLEHVLAGFGGQSSALDELEREIAAGSVEPTAREALDRIASRGSSAGRYEFRERIGQGGMGAVFRVHDRDLDRELALKVIRRSRSGGPPGSALDRRAERFLAEARLAARLDHPGIVPVHDVGIDGQGRLFFTMRLVRGEDFRSVLNRVHARTDGWTQMRALEVLIKVCDTVAFAHSSGIVHRDLKPANVMVGRFGEAYVLDWGLARSLPPRAGSERSAIAGTPAYMAPEQAVGETAGVRADVYSLGAMLYELLAGCRPYEAQGIGGFDAVLTSVRSGPPEDLENLAPTASAELVAVCREAMAREPSRRYGSASEFATELRAYLEGRVVRAHARGAIAELRKWIRRNRALAAALGATVLSTVGGLTAVSITEAHGKAEILRLADARRLVDLERRAEVLWPAVPASVGALRGWLADAEALASRREQHADDFARLRSDFSPDTEQRWRFDLLAALVGDLGRFADPERGTIASVRARLAFAGEIHGRSLVAGGAAWRDAVASIADRTQCPRYRGLALAPQLGLLPLGRDPESGLWEFADLSSGEPPKRRGDGTLALSPGSAIVLVLIPLGEFEMGSRPAEPAGDAWARDEESPAHAHQIGAFFLAKHELTRTQWSRARAGWPWRPGEAGEDALLPAAGVSWDDARAVLLRLGLDLPSEAQWEYAARADTQTRWWSGNEPGSLAGCANGARAVDAGSPGHRVPQRATRVDRLRSNPFGLHHVHGNVAEWTADAWRPRYDSPDPEADAGLRSVRGGGYASPAAELRSAARAPFARDARSPEIGIRPTRALERSAPSRLNAAGR